MYRTRMTVAAADFQDGASLSRLDQCVVKRELRVVVDKRLIECIAAVGQIGAERRHGGK